MNDPMQSATAQPECSCPSGDGSLRWPCAAHPPAGSPADAVQGEADKLAALLCCLYEGDEIVRAASLLIEQAIDIEELRATLAAAEPMPDSEAVSVPVEIRSIAQQMRTQDNECTANPLFYVEQQRTITGIDTDYDPEIVWCIEDSMIFKGDEEFAALETAYAESGTVPENYTRTGYVHEWEFVTAFFTRSAAEQFVVQHGHKYSGPLRMSVETEPRNREMNLVRDFLQSLADVSTTSGAAGQKGGSDE